MTFSVTFGETVSRTRTNLIHDGAMTYRNVLPDGSFPLNYQTDQEEAWLFDSSTSVVGEYSIRHRPDALQRRIKYLHDTTSGAEVRIPVTPGTKYVLSAWVRVDSDMDLQLGAFWFDNGFVMDTDYAGYVAIEGNRWTYLFMTMTAPAGAEEVIPFVQKPSTTPAKVGFNVSGWVFESTTQNFGWWFTPGPYFDGDIEPTYPAANETVSVEWNGTPGQSSSTMTYETTAFSGDLLSVDVSHGRRTLQDLSTPSTCTLEVLDPTTIPDLDTTVKVEFTGDLNTYTIFHGYVRDTTVIHSPVVGLDVLRIEADSYLSKAGRAEITKAAETDADASALVTQVLNDNLLGSEPIYQSPSMTVSHNDYQGNLLTYLQRLQTTVFGFINDSENEAIIFHEYDGALATQQGGGFTDVLPVTDEIVYSGIRFGSMEEKAISYVRIEPEVDAVTVGESGSGTRSLVLQSFSASDADAQYLADVNLAAFTNATPCPREITIETAAQSNESWLKVIDVVWTGYRDWPGCQGQKQSVTFRGTTYDVVIQGCQLTATPDAARITFYLESLDAYPMFLILDDTERGLLSSGLLGE